MKNKQNVLNGMLIVITMLLLVWNIKQHQDINTLRAENTSLKGSISGVGTIVGALKDADSGFNYRISNTEEWIYNFEDIMFGTPEETSTEE